MPAEARLSEEISRFCATLRRAHGFRIGIGETRDVLRALDVVGTGDERRFRAALRAVICGRYQDIEAFEREFDAFFLGRVVEPRAIVAREVAVHSSPSTWEALVAKYSPAAGRGAAPDLSPVNDMRYARAVDALLNNLRLGRTRRWRANDAGPRFDLRRTLRLSLHTAGEAVRLRKLSHPRRNPRVLAIIDGSRSMSEHAAGILHFARALVRRTPRAHAFVFSTTLREITGDLRRGVLPVLGDAWGGGTRIGQALRDAVRTHGGLFEENTLALVFSDGLDFGDSVELARAAAEIRRRSAGLVWLSPNAGQPRYLPVTQGMRAVLPSLTALLAASDVEGLARVAKRL
ncbi:MAG: VWA domain-containing protein [Vulcanimicrobiaceae bacterium]